MSPQKSAAILNVFPGFGLGYLYLGYPRRFLITSAVWLGATAVMLLLAALGIGVGFWSCGLGAAGYKCFWFSQLSLGILAALWVAGVLRGAIGALKTPIRPPPSPKAVLALGVFPGFGAGYLAVRSWNKLRVAAPALLLLPIAGGWSLETARRSWNEGDPWITAAAVGAVLLALWLLLWLTTAYDAHVLAKQSGQDGEARGIGRGWAVAAVGALLIVSAAGVVAGVHGGRKQASVRDFLNGWEQVALPEHRGLTLPSVVFSEGDPSAAADQFRIVPRSLGGVWLSRHTPELFHFDGSNITALSHPAYVKIDVLGLDASGRPICRITSRTEQHLAVVEGEEFVSLPPVPGQEPTKYAVGALGTTAVRNDSGQIYSYSGNEWDPLGVFESSSYFGIRSLMVGRDGTVWAEDYCGGWGSAGCNLTRFDGDGRETVSFPPYLSMHLDTDGRVVLSTEEGSLVRWRDGVWVTFVEIPRVAARRDINSITIESDDRVWFATDRGLVVAENGKAMVLDSGNFGLPHDDVRSITLDANGRAWIVTTGGVVAYQRNRE